MKAATVIKWVLYGLGIACGLFLIIYLFKLFGNALSSISSGNTQPSSKSSGSGGGSSGGSYGSGGSSGTDSSSSSNSSAYAGSVQEENDLNAEADAAGFNQGDTDLSEADFSDE